MCPFDVIRGVLAAANEERLKINDAIKKRETTRVKMKRTGILPTRSRRTNKLYHITATNITLYSFIIMLTIIYQ